ncbi:hypothetical protein [Photobacterium leiognathi]|uniref:hypothetical protein n=1 Tax=Photobacterium leiognathi TaxID=553611 RepID=UPI0027399B1C|nr:hypothetical protein [Photobacterium leiognathi]
MDKRQIVFLSIVLTVTALVAFALYEEKIKPKQATLDQLVTEYILTKGETLPQTTENEPAYLSGRADLDNNGKQETFILMQIDKYCDKQQCNAYLFDDKDKVIAKWKNIQRPVLLGNDTTDGWKNIILTTNDQMYIIKHNKTQYNQDMSKAPIYDDKDQAFEAVGLAIDSDYYQKDGTNLELDYSQPIFDCQSCYLFSYEKFNDDASQLYYLSVDVTTKRVRTVEASTISDK